jgi:hypothetical protein
LGAALQNAFNGLKDEYWSLTPYIKQNAMNNSKLFTNEALVRCTPMAVWGCDLNQDNFRNAVACDVEFTHT